MSAAIALTLTTSVHCASFDRRTFAAALARIRHVIARRPALPALEAVLIEVVADALTLTATDAGTFVRVSVPATVATPGALLVPLRRLSDTSKGTGPRLQIAGEQVVSGGVTHHLTTLPAESFPTVPALKGEVLASLMRPALARLLAQTAYAMSGDPTRPHLAALFVERRAGELRLVATDGHRLAIAGVADDGPSFTMLVPRTTVLEVVRMVAVPGGLVRIRREGDRVWFASGTDWVTGPVVDAPYPAVDQVIPSDNSGRVTMVSSELREALRVLVPRGAEGVRITPDKDGAVVKLSVADAEGNSTEASVPASFEGELPEAVGVNGRYLREVVDALTDEDRTVTLAIRGELDPVRVDGVRGGTTAVVMPMRL